MTSNLEQKTGVLTPDEPNGAPSGRENALRPAVANGKPMRKAVFLFAYI